MLSEKCKRHFAFVYFVCLFVAVVVHVQAIQYVRDMLRVLVCGKRAAWIPRLRYGGPPCVEANRLRWFAASPKENGTEMLSSLV